MNSKETSRSTDLKEVNSRERINPLCPECGASAFPVDQPHFGLDIIDITTPDDRELGNIRLVLRCQGCGYATSFIGRKIVDSK